MEYQINKQQDNNFVDFWFYQSKNSQGQIIRCEVYRMADDTTSFNFEFFIKDKRKSPYPKNQITGKDGIKSLVWAYKCLKDCIDFLKNMYPNTTLIVFGDNKRKQCIYKRYLTPLGFKCKQNKDKTLYLKFK